MSDQINVDGQTYPIPNSIEVQTTSGETINYLRSDIVNMQVQDAINELQQENESEPVMTRGVTLEDDENQQPIVAGGHTYPNVQAIEAFDPTGESVLYSLGGGDGSGEGSDTTPTVREFVATYGETPYAELKTEYGAGKKLVCERKSSGQTYRYYLTRVTDTSFDFGGCFWQGNDNGCPVDITVYCLKDLNNDRNGWVGKHRNVYSLPSDRIPLSDLSDEVQNILNNSYSIPSGGIPANALSSEVQTVLSNAYTLPSTGIPTSDLSNDVQNILSNAYALPSTGIPAAALSSSIQETLSLAETGYQKPEEGIPASDLAQEYALANSSNGDHSQVLWSTATTHEWADVPGFTKFITNSESYETISVNDAAPNVPIKSLNVQLLPALATDGTPLPTNVLQFKTFNEVTISHSDSNVENPTEYVYDFSQLDEPIYGGCLNLLTGQLVKNVIKLTIRQKNINSVTTASNGNKYAIVKVSGLNTMPNPRATICNMLPRFEGAVKDMSDNQFCCYHSAPNAYNADTVAFKLAGIELTSAAYKAEVERLYEAGTPLEIIYWINQDAINQDNNTIIDLEPSNIHLFNGENYIWSSDGYIDLEYYVNTNGLIPSPSDDLPTVSGIRAHAGISNGYSRADHAHALPIENLCYTYQSIGTTSSDPAISYSTLPNSDFKSIKIIISPYQNGTGDPSSSNIRTFVSCSGVTLYHGDGTASTPNSASFDFGEPIYGGELDVATGVLSVTYEAVDLATAIAASSSALIYETEDLDTYTLSVGDEYYVNIPTDRFIKGEQYVYYRSVTSKSDLDNNKSTSQKLNPLNIGIYNYYNSSASSLAEGGNTLYFVVAHGDIPSGKLLYKRREPRIINLTGYTFQQFIGLNELYISDTLNNNTDNITTMCKVSALTNTLDNLHIVTPEMYGAVGNGLVDDTVALHEALATGNIVLARNKYLIREVLITNNSSFASNTTGPQQTKQTDFAHLVCTANTRFIRRGAYGHAEQTGHNRGFFCVRGTSVATTNIIADAIINSQNDITADRELTRFTIGKRTVSVEDSSIFEIGDVVRIVCNGTGAEGNKILITQVVEINGSTLTLAHNLNWSYGTINDSPSTITKIRPITFIAEGNGAILDGNNIITRSYSGRYNDNDINHMTTQFNWYGFSTVYNYKTNISNFEVQNSESGIIRMGSSLDCVLSKLSGKLAIDNNTPHGEFCSIGFSTGIELYNIRSYSYRRAIDWIGAYLCNAYNCYSYDGGFSSHGYLARKCGFYNCVVEQPGSTTGGGTAIGNRSYYYDKDIEFIDCKFYGMNEAISIQWYCSAIFKHCYFDSVFGQGNSSARNIGIFDGDVEFYNCIFNSKGDSIQFQHSSSGFSSGSSIAEQKTEVLTRHNGPFIAIINNCVFNNTIASNGQIIRQGDIGKIYITNCTFNTNTPVMKNMLNTQLHNCNVLANSTEPIFTIYGSSTLTNSYVQGDITVALNTLSDEMYDKVSIIGCIFDEIALSTINSAANPSNIQIINCSSVNSISLSSSYVANANYTLTNNAILGFKPV